MKNNDYVIISAATIDISSDDVAISYSEKLISQSVEARINTATLCANDDKITVNFSGRKNSNYETIQKLIKFYNIAKNLSGNMKGR